MADLYHLASITGKAAGKAFTRIGPSHKKYVVTKSGNKTAATSSDPATVLEELKELATKLGFEVRQEKLLREVGYHVRSGSCRVRDTNIILLDRTLPVSAQIDVLVEELAGSRLDDVYLSPQLRKLLEGATA